jgi:hypothetical protein
MDQCCPRIWYIQKESVCIDLYAFHCETVIDDIAPGGSDVGEAEIMEELLGYFSALLVELEGVEVSVLDCLRNCTR